MDLVAIANDYLKKLRERAKKSRVYKKHQMTGLRIGRRLDDSRHKTLYMKLAKEGNPARLEWLAAEIAAKGGIKKKGAYFMKVLLNTEKEAKTWLRRKDGQARRGPRGKALSKRKNNRIL